MARAYLEANVFTEAVRRGDTAAKIRESLCRNDYVPVTGLNTVFELAQAFLNPEHAGEAPQRFRVLSDLDPTYDAQVSDLLAQEVRRLRRGIAVVPFLGPLDRTSTRTEVERLARGVFDDRAREFTAQRREAMLTQFPQNAQDYIDRVVAAVGEERLATLRTFQDVLAELNRSLPAHVSEVLEGEPTEEESRELAARIDSFPTLRSVTRAFAYISFICVSNRVVPGRDKLNDYRHVVEASYCDYFITRDQQLLGTAPRINPSIRVIQYDTVFGGTS